MDAKKEAEVKSYIQKKEQASWETGILDTVTNLSSLEKETKEWFLSEWLKNDKGLLSYAELFMKTDKLNIWESIKFKLLDVKLSITCSYFSDFKDFLEELKRWNDTSEEMSSTGVELSNESSESASHTFCGIDIKDIKSEPFQKSSEMGVTRCSKTALYNWKNFNVDLPSGNAYDAGKNPWKGCLTTIPRDKQNEKPQNKREWISIDTFKSEWKWNYADVYTNSKSSYGHRASAFKDDKWERYVLDPYTRVNWKLDNSPKKLSDYLSVRKIVKAHMYESSWYKWLEASVWKKSHGSSWESTDSNVEQADWKVEKAIHWALNIANDDSYWYEWWGRGNKNGKKGYDCASLVCTAFKEAWFDVPITWCSPIQKNFEKVWFKRIPWPIKSEDIKTWDIILERKKHVELCVWDNKVVWAHTNKDGKAWDSSWNEISVRSTKSVLGYMNPDWILRYMW